jgi:hypothetical protein
MGRRGRSFSPQGWDSIAQGNALGTLSQPFGLRIIVNPFPRALPWAMLSQPCGLKTGV